MKHKKIIVALSIILVFFSACARRQTTITPPPTEIDAIGRVLDGLNESLNLAADFYVRQKTACENQSRICRFSPESLERVRKILFNANQSYRVAVGVYESVRAGIVPIEQAQTKVNDAIFAVKEAEQACGKTGCKR